MLGASWRTTVFGMMAAVGGAVVAGIATGYIDVTHLPPWVKGLAGLLSIIGTAGVGATARDNQVTSEQAGAGQSSGGGKMTLLLVTLLLGGSLLLCCLPGCGTNAPTKAAQAERVLIQSVNDGMAEWAAYVNAGKATQKQIDQVHQAYDAYYAAQLGVKAAIEKALSKDPSATPEELASAKATAETAQSALLTELNGILRKGIHALI